MPLNSRIFDQLQTDGALASRLAALSARRQLRSVSVGLQIAGRRMFAATEETGQASLGEIPEMRVRAGCLAKPLTATLVAEAVASSRIDWAAEINNILGIAGPAKCKLTQVTVSQLLNHTHGLDRSDIGQTPLTNDGFIDAPALCQQLAKRPLSEPGELYSYSDTGPQLAAAALEKLSGKRYGQLLGMSRIISSHAEQSERATCPAIGGGFELTLSQWLSFLDSHLQSDHSSATTSGLEHCVAALRSAPVPLPGWSAAEQAAARGWKYYGDGWFGHNANMADRSSLLRFNPQQAIAIVMSAADEGAFFALAGLFGTALPEFANLMPPRLLTSGEREQLQLEQYAGTYARARMSIEVTATSSSGLSLVTHAQPTSGSPRLLKPAHNQVFIPESRDDPDLPFVQFVKGPRSSHFNYLWNGKQLWRRT